MHRHANKNNINNNLNDQVKIYFPTIPIQLIQNALYGTPNSNKKQNQNQTQNQKQHTAKIENTQLDKYLHSETQKTIIYGTTSILEIVNNEPYPIYPSDKMTLISTISVSNPKQSKQLQQPNQLQLLIDYSTMKRNKSSAYQIPYDFKVHSCIVKKYKIDPKSNTFFVIEYKDNKIYDFYVVTKLSASTTKGISTNRIELDNFIKEDIISFLLMLNLY